MDTRKALDMASEALDKIDAAMIVVRDARNALSEAQADVSIAVAKLAAYVSIEKAKAE